jgi:hypothetical protein
MAVMNAAEISPNWTKTAPTTRVNSRQLAFYLVEITGVETGYLLADSVFSKAVRGAMTQGEMFVVGKPAAGAFVIVMACDTAGDNGDTEEFDLGVTKNGAAQSLADAVAASTGGAAAVTVQHLEGAVLADGRTKYEAEQTVG